MPGIPQAIQVICVVAIGLGAGLLTAGQYLEPPIAAMTPADLARFWERSNDIHIVASILRGLGVFLLTTGSLGVVIPWVNALVLRPRSSAPAVTANSQTQPSTLETSP